MGIDAPVEDAQVGSEFFAGGWAIDTAARADSGISVMDVSAYPADRWDRPMPTAVGNHADARIIGGNFNAWPDQSSIATMTTRYGDAWAVAAASGRASSFAGNGGETKKGRIDYIDYSKDASVLSLRTVEVPDTRDASGRKPSDHRPVLATFDVK